MKYLVILCFIYCSSCKTSNKQKIYLELNKTRLFIEVADTEEKRSTGLMNRKLLPKNHGMLFVFERPKELNFWMKNTLIPLSIAYLNKACVITDIQQMSPADKNDPSPKIYTSKKPSIYALETNINWYRENNLKIGDKITSHSKEITICNKK